MNEETTEEPGSIQEKVKNAPSEQDVDGQDEYDRVVMAGSEVMYGDAQPQVLEMLKGMADNPPEALGQTAVMIITQIDEKMGGKIPDDVLVQAATELTEELGALAAAQGIFDVDEKILQKAGHEMLISLGDEYDFDPQEIQAMMGDLGEEEVRSIYKEQAGLYG